MNTKDTAPYEDQRFGVPGKKTQSEAEQQLKRMIQTQLDTSVTLQRFVAKYLKFGLYQKDLNVSGLFYLYISQLKKQKTFASAQIYKPLSEEMAGAKSLEEYRCIQEHECTIESLRQYGFTNDEIQFKLEQQGLAPKVRYVHNMHKYLNKSITVPARCCFDS